MNKRTIAFITVILFFAAAALIFMFNSCYYQMYQIKADADLDPGACKIEGRPVKFRIENTSHHDLVQYGFSLAAYSKEEQTRVSHDAYTMHLRIPQGHSIDGCFAVPGMEELSPESVSSQFYFRLRLFIAVFDQGDDKRRTCR